jgi:signal transduction histidine kinase/DNA-binding response OmpR family regulator/ligand-binding sensor domain-containing protein
MKVKPALLLFALLFAASASGQPKCFFEHYGVEDGLPQNSIMDMMQDDKGFMWFSTWNGLCKFDGYNFYTYKIQQGTSQIARSNRIDVIRGDKYGYIWTLPYDLEPLRFDPSAEKFAGLKSIPEYRNFSFTATNIIVAKSGKTWLLSDHMGCVCVQDSTFRNVVVFNKENNNMHAGKVYLVHEDENLNSWILTDNGLYLYSRTGKITAFFSGEDGAASRSAQNFYTAMELKTQIWFGSDNGRIWIYDKKDERFTLLEAKTASCIQNIRNINGCQILLATRNDGFFIYHLTLKTFDKYTTAVLPGMCSNEVMSCYIDRSSNVWLELNCFGVSKFDLDTRSIKRFEMKVESKILDVFPPNFYMLEDRENRLWVHPRGGGFAFYDPEKDELVPFYNELFSPSWRFSNVVQVAFSDRQGNLWLSTRSHGLEKIIFNNDVFNSKIVDKDVYSTINNDIRAMLETANRNLWVSTKGEKLYVYDSEWNRLGYLCKDGRIGNGVPLDGICYCIMEDRENNIWIGTKGEGVYRLTPTHDPLSFRIKQFKNNPADLYSLSNNNVYSIFQDKNKRIWIGTYGGGLNLLDDERKERFVSYKNSLKNYPAQHGAQVRTISSDKFGNLCVGTTLGLIMFSPDFKSANAIDYRLYIKMLGDRYSLGGNDVYDICTTATGDTYIATFGGGLNRIVEVGKDGFPEKFTSYGVNEGLPSDVILTVVEDSQGKLWIATEGNLTKFDPDKNLFETFSEVSRLIKGQTFSENARCASRSGYVYFGFTKGIISIDPGKVNANTFMPYIALTKLQIANKDVPVGGDSPLQENLDDVERIELEHTQNIINIEFVALDYIEPKRIMYAYKLDGFDKDWIVTQKQRIANYTNLSPGSYTFRVKSTNSDGIWMENEHVLKIEIKPSFWQTSWAYMVYVALVGIIIYIVLNIFFSFYRLENKVKLEYEQTEMKSRFFTDISHEIRTPLTMIVSPVEHILESEDTKIPEFVRTQLQLVLKNANRMLRMVNQILDFRKIQKQTPNIQETVVAPFVQEICNNFTETAEERDIHLVINNRIGDEKLWIDRDSFEQLLYNLLSNAFKYTHSGKTIEVSLTSEKRDNVIALTVKDEGKGMNREILNKLFTRFASFNKDRNQPSTGIGLSIVKEVADKHHAKISVESELAQGSSFTVFFHKGVDHFKGDAGIIFTYSEPAKEQEPVIPPDSKTGQPADEDRLVHGSSVRQTILVAEDDEDMRRFITTMLEPYYHVLEASDGKKGFDLAVAKLPDFIISDIMMPEVDGVELLKKIRENENTSHIPFILLTAKNALESKIDGLEYGADDYITKPFNVKYLHARIENIIFQRRRLFSIFAHHRESMSPRMANIEPKQLQEQERKITSLDEHFIMRVKEEVEKNIDDSTFLIDDLVANLAMSRTVFFKKLKSLTGMAPIDFIRDIKIRHAAELLKTQEYTVKETSFMIGISDSKYFSRCFKAIFGMTPTEYKRLNR